MKRLILIFILLPLAALRAQSPGGESNDLLFWLRGDAGTSTTTNGANVWNWTDQSGNGVSPWISSAPVYRNPEVNYNPALDWDGSASLGMQNNGMQGGGNRKTVIIAFKTDSDVNSRQVLFEYGVSNPPPFRHGMNIYIDGGNLYGMLIESRNEYSASTPIAANTAYIFIMVYNGPSGRWDGYLNGTQVINNASAPSSLPSDYDNGGIGCIQGGTQFAGSNNRVTSGNKYQGHIMEMAFYDDDAFNGSERDNMFSYLGAKYGITVDQDYNFAAGSTTYWDQSSNSTYHNNIAVVARDDDTDLDQRQAKSASSDGLLSIGFNSIATDNASNSNSHNNDEDYFAVGSDGGSTTDWTTTGAPAGYAILNRTWKYETNIDWWETMVYQVPGNSSSASTKLPAHQNNVFLFMDGDGDYTSTDDINTMTQSGTNWEHSQWIWFYGYLTIATEAIDASLSVTQNGDESGPVDIEYTVTLSATNNTGSPITFDLADLGTGSATSGSDYSAIPGGAQISVANGSSTGTYTVTVTDDPNVESTETVDAQISNPSTGLVNITTASASADITDNDVASSPGPGGVSSDLVFWLKADEGTNTTTDGAGVNDWADQSGNSNDATDLGTDPSYDQIANSYNPAIDFSGTADGLGISNTGDINTNSSSAKSYAVVFKTGSDINTRQLIYEEGGGTHGLNISIESGNLYTNLWVSQADNSASTPIAANTSYVVIFVYDGSSGRWDTYVNGSLAMSDGSVPSSLPAHGGAIGLGEINNATQYDGNNDVNDGDGFMGSIMEMAYYNDKVFNSSERDAIFSYLGLKYGISISHDYISAGSATTIWDNSANSGYNNDIAGFGRDDDSELDQKQGLSANTYGMVSMGLGSVATDNASNGNSFSNDEAFMLWGNDGGSIGDWTTTGAPAGYAILNRTWKYQETGTFGNFEIQVPDNTSGAATKLPAEQNNVYLFVDDDPAFTAGGAQHTMSQSGSNWEYTHSTDSYVLFTFATDAIDASLSVTQNGDESGPVDIIYTVTLSATNNTGSAITFDLSDLGTGSATSGSDYTAIPGGAQISVANGSSTGTYSVTVTDDGATESTETVDLQISNPSTGLVNITTASASGDIADNDQFVAAPGGVLNNLNVWLRADTGTSTTTDNTSLTTWSDLSSQNNDGTSDGNPPTFRDNLSDNVNFHPTVEFDDVNDRLVLDLSAIKSGSGNGDYTMLAVGIREDNNFNIVLGGEGGTGNQDLHFGYRDGNDATLAHWGNDIDVNVPDWNVPGLTPYLLSGEYDGSGRIVEEFRDGNFSRNTDNNTTDLQGTKANYIGHVDYSGVDYYDGLISEIIVYDEDVSDLEKLQIYSYLALKYGFMLSNNLDDDGNTNEVISGGIREGDLVASDGSTVIWDYNNMGASYFNDLAGIGLDSLSYLHQKQSKSLSQDALVTIGLGSIAASNKANSNAFSADLDFLVWGNDDGGLNGASSNADLTAQSGAVDQLQRTWKIHETGSVGSVQLAFPKSNIDSYLNTYIEGSLYLRVADDAALTTNVVDVPLSESSINGTNSYVGNHDFDGTKYFTIVQKGFIIWTGTEWRGGLSTITDHAPSDEAGDATKPLYIEAGDTARIDEAVEVDSIDVASSAVLVMNTATCLRTDKATSSGDMIFEADATGFAQYKGPAVTATMQQYIDNFGWHLIGSPFSNVTWDDLGFENSTGIVNHPVDGSSKDSCNYCNLWWYDTSTDNGTDIGFMSSTAYGTWRTSTDGSQSFGPDKGWNFFFDKDQNFGSEPWTISLTGSLNDGAVSQTINENNSGWNLVANPYPSVIDWDEVDDDLASENIAMGYHIWDHANTNFAVYANGSGTLGANQYIAPMQGFYIQTATAGAQNSGDVYHSFNLDNGDRPDVCQSGGGTNIFKSSLKVADQLKLRTRHLGSGKIDETVIQFGEGASREYNSQEDIRKLLTTHKDVPSVFVNLGTDLTTITAMPMPQIHDSVDIGLRTQEGSALEINAVDMPQGMELYLEDLKDGKWHKLDHPLSFNHDKDLQRKRFVLHYGYGPIETRDWRHQNPFSVHIDEHGLMVIKTLKRITNSDWYLSSVSGKVVARGHVDGDTGTRQQVDISHLKPGVYVFVLFEGDKKFTDKLPKVH